MTSQERSRNRDLWKARVAAFKESNQSVAKWCQENDLKKTTLYNWIRKFREEENSTSQQWMPISISQNTQEVSKKGLLIRIGRAEIEVQSEFEPSLLLKVARTLDQLC